jgi:cytochrome P450
MHSFKRKRVTAAYSMSTICSLEPQINHITQSVWSKFRNMADTGRLIDLQEWTIYYASDVVCQLGLGAPLGFVETGGDVNGILSSIHTYFYAAANLGYIPGRTMWVDNPLMRALVRLFGSSDNAGSHGLNNWIVSQITCRLKSDPDEKRSSDMLDHFLSMKDPSGKTVGLPDVAVEGGNLLGAGGDTTAVGIAVVLKYLLSHPEDYKRLQQEVDNAYADHLSGGESGEHLSYDIASRLPFLSACIKEGTRLVPSILWQLPRECPKEGITIAGHFIPPKATLSMSPVAQNRCKEVFGEDANEWRPERFIVGDGGMPAEYVRNIEKHLVTVSMPQVQTSFLQSFRASTDSHSSSATALELASAAI